MTKSESSRLKYCLYEEEEDLSTPLLSPSPQHTHPRTTKPPRRLGLDVQRPFLFVSSPCRHHQQQQLPPVATPSGGLLQDFDFQQYCSDEWLFHLTHFDPSTTTTTTTLLDAPTPNEHETIIQALQTLADPTSSTVPESWQSFSTSSSSVEPILQTEPARSSDSSQTPPDQPPSDVEPLPDIRDAIPFQTPTSPKLRSEPTLPDMNISPQSGAYSASSGRSTSSSSSSSSAAAETPHKIISKRQRNTEAARRYRQRKVERVSELEEALLGMTAERDELKLKLARSEAEADVLRGMVGRR